MALYKALAADRKSSASWGLGFGPWVVDEWHEVAGPLVLGQNGFHCSDDILWCMDPVQVAYIAAVETDGESIIQGKTQCWQKMRVTSIKEWTPAKANLVVSWTEGRAHDYWAGIFPSEAALYDAANYQSQFSTMLSIIQPVYKSLFENGDTIVRFATQNHKRKSQYIPALERVVYLAYLLALALTGNITIRGGGGLCRIAEDVRPGSWEIVRGFTEDHWAGLEEV